MKVFQNIILVLALCGAAMGAQASDTLRDNDAYYTDYEAKDPKALEGLLNARAAIRDALVSLDTHGLSAQHYQSKLDAVATADSAALLEFVKTLIADLRFGVTRDAASAENQEMVVQALLPELAACNDVKACLQRIAARHPQYEMLQITLQEYAALAQKGGWPKIPAGSALKPENQDPRVPMLRSRLRMSGDYTVPHEQTHQSLQYDAQLVEAVKEFQRRHGLKDDGVIGSATLTALNVPIEKRMSQLRLSLERLRRLDEVDDARYVRVNIPSFTLTAYEGQVQILEMPVVVGQASRPTPLFDNVITTIGLNPTWTPTSKILSQDLLPKFRRNPSYAARGGYSIRDRYTGESLNPHQVDWHSVSARDIQVVQRAGTNNALGKVKFLLPNNQSVYLHDTSHPELFASAMRALSSGCIRLSDPKRFLDYVIESQPDESFASLRSDYEGRSSKHVSLVKPIRVQTTYFTAWVDKNGLVTFHEDVYRRDSRLELALERFSPQYAMR